jgi:peroxiredoxin Q/BCP
MKVALAVGAAVAVLAVIYFVSSGNNSDGQAGKYTFSVGSPGSGEMAPTLKLASTAGGTFDLAAQRGKTVLLYFQEGLTCQPCWDQLKDIQAQQGAFGALKIDQIVSITSDPLDALKQKVADEGITIPVLSDMDLAVSRAYAANQYGMMEASRDGHTFIVVGPDARIRWRADYGGAPNYTMYVPVPDLLADLRTGLHSGGA